MSLKRFHFDKGHECCYTCMYIDEYAFNVSDEGEVPHGYDGMAVCCECDDKESDSNDSRLFISPCWKVCPKYKRCTERQADYLDIFDPETQSIIENPHKPAKL